MESQANANQNESIDEQTDIITEETPATESEPLKQEDGDGTLPANVTKEPQHPEHMDLRGMQGYQRFLNTYLGVSDDNGEFLGDTVIEREVQQLCTTLTETDILTCQNPQEMVNRITEYIRRYNPLVNEAENTAVGILTKYRIRQGMLLVHQKRLVKKRLEKNWGEWFKEAYDASMYRSAQDYMRIAGVPNAIRYAVFGKERLLNIVSRLGNTNTQDPIGEFLRCHGIDFDPRESTDYEEIRIRTDVAIARSLLNQNDLAEVPDDKLDAYVRAGNQIKPPLLEQLKLAKQTGSNMVDYMDQLIAGGRPGPILTSAVKAKSFKNTLKKFLALTEEAMNDDNYLGEIDDEDYQRLKEMVLGLEALIQQRSTD